jgi:hypothetical protein
MFLLTQHEQQEGRPMGERSQRTLFQPAFNRGVRVERGSTDLTGDTGVIVAREAMEQLGLPGAFRGLADPRNQAQIRFPLVDLVMTRLAMLAQGWTDQDDVTALRGDPAFRVATSTTRGERVVRHDLASQPTLSRLMGTLGGDHNREVLERILRDVGLRRAGEDHRRRLVVDVDSFPVEAHGKQEGAVYNGHYHADCFHPLAAFADTGDLLAIDLRPGNVHTALDVREFVEPVLTAARQGWDDVWLRFDAGFASGTFFDWLDERGVGFVTRLRSNKVLHDRVADWRARTAEAWGRTRTHGASPREATFDFWYQAKDWSRLRRVVAVLVERSDRDGTLFDDVFFLCTSAARPVATSAAILETYRGRGSAEARIGEFVNEVLPNLSSTTHDANEATLRLAAIAYQVVHFLRRRLEVLRKEGMSLRRLRERFLKAPARLICHARRALLQVGPTFHGAWEQLADVLRPNGTMVEVAR